MIDKGPPKHSRDVPAETALARIFNVVNPVVQAYDKQKVPKAATGFLTKVPINPNVRIVNQEMQQYVDNEELECAVAIGSTNRAEVAAQICNVEDGFADGNRGSDGVEQTLPVPCGNAVSGKQSAITSDRAVVVGSTDATGIVGVQDGTRSVTPTTTDCATKGANIKGVTRFHDKGDDYEGLQISRSNCKAIGLKNVAKVWSVVSPSKRAATDFKKQEFASENIRCTNAFDALAIEQEDGENDAGKKLELV
ncbi:hypothetical protein A4A49_26290 [Nicotiana attenuata]|uniref:Uncharacterized protein n=1 Tax=Nicotiana attenuata TaxID=49451 RepID=A0A1J6K9V8_NICAT|nr:hypothetical protein A4A49_26290 [Nicotiana attenuata]